MGFGYVSDRVAKLPHRKVLARDPGIWELGSPTPGNFAAMSAIVDHVCWIGAQFSQSTDRRELYVVGMERIHLHEQALLHIMLDGTENVPGLRNIPGVKVYADDPNLARRDLIIAMGIDGMDLSKCVEAYRNRGVIVFERLNTSPYSQRAVEAIGTTGVIRVSPLHCHNKKDIEKYLLITKEIALTYAQN